MVYVPYVNMHIALIGSMMSEFEIEKRCSYGKSMGIVQLSPTHLVWTPDSAGDGNELQVALTSIRQYQVSKAGSAKKAKIQLVCSDRDGPIRLDFGKNFADRDAVRDVLNRLHAQDPPSSSRAATGGGAAGGRGAAPPQPRGDRRPVLEGHQVPLQAERRAARGRRGGGRARDRGRHRRAQGRAHARVQQPGGGEDVCGLEPKNWAGGVPSPAQRHRIFMLLPVAARAHAALVPKKLAGAAFWSTLAKSTMARKLSKELRLKRNAGTATEADAVFAEFHAGERAAAARDSNAQEAALCRELAMHRFDDHRSAHVLEGHGATGDAPRSATRAGAGRAGGNLPASSHLRIMREVNRHGRLIVDSSSKRMRTAAGEQQRFATLSADALQKATPVFDAHKGNRDRVGVQDVVAFADSLAVWEADTTDFKYPISSSAKLVATGAPASCQLHEAVQTTVRDVSGSMDARPSNCLHMSIIAYILSQVRNGAALWRPEIVHKNDRTKHIRAQNTQSSRTPQACLSRETYAPMRSIRRIPRCFARKRADQRCVAQVAVVGRTFPALRYGSRKSAADEYEEIVKYAGWSWKWEMRFVAFFMSKSGHHGVISSALCALWYRIAPDDARDAGCRYRKTCRRYQVRVCRLHNACANADIIADREARRSAQVVARLSTVACVWPCAASSHSVGARAVLVNEQSTRTVWLRSVMWTAPAERCAFRAVYADAGALKRHEAESRARNAIVNSRLARVRNGDAKLFKNAGP
eukprot:IDg1754t1